MFSIIKPTVKRFCSQDLQIFKKCYMSQMNPKEVFHNTACSVQIPYILPLNLNSQRKNVVFKTLNIKKLSNPAEQFIFNKNSALSNPYL